MISLQKIKARFSGRPDSEHQQAVMRLVLCVTAGLYFFPAALRLPHPGLFIGQGLFMVYTVALLVWIYLNPEESPIRRYVGALGDILTLTFAMIFLGNAGLSVYALFIWVTTANGFRYGSRYLLAALAMGTVGLIAVFAISPLYHGKTVFGAELIVIYVALCLYFNKLVKDLFDSVARANQASDAKRQFLSNMSHELRTPLHAITGISEMMRRASSPAKLQSLQDALDSAVRSMLRLVNDVLDFSKIEAGKTDIAIKAFNLHEMMAEIAKLFRTTATAKGIALRFHVANDVPAYVLGDEVHLQQVLNNLLSNAIKFTHKGSVSVSVTTLFIRDGIHMLQWTVVDTGIGIPKEKQATIFESFTQADASVTLKYGGTGLGTTIASELVALMGGKIGLTSEKDVGTSFWIQVPLQIAADHSSYARPSREKAIFAIVNEADEGEAFRNAIRLLLGGAQCDRQKIAELIDASANPALGLVTDLASGRLPAEAVHAMEKNVPVVAFSREPILEARQAALYQAGVLSVVDQLNGLPAAIGLLAAWMSHDAAADVHADALPSKTILVADDSDTNRMILRELFESEGHIVLEATNGEDALDTLFESHVDLIIIDMNMPVLDGVETTKIIRAMSSDGNQLPIIMLTADATESAHAIAASAGVTAFITKPVRPGALSDQVSRLFAHQNSTVGGRQPLQRAAGAVQAAILNPHSLVELKSISSDATFIPNLIARFLEDAKILLAKIEKSVAEQDYEAWQDNLHALNGSSNSLGLERLADALKCARAMAPAMLPAGGMKMYRRILDEFKGAEAALLEHS